MQNDCGYIERAQCDDPLRPNPGAGACDYPERCAHLFRARECPFYTFVGLKRDILALKTVARRPTDDELVRELNRRRAVVSPRRKARVAVAFATVTALVNDVCVVHTTDAQQILIPEWSTFCHVVRVVEVITPTTSFRVPSAHVKLVRGAGLLVREGGAS